MTNESIIDLISRDPGVIRANTRTNPDGTSVVPSPAELRSLASGALDTLLSTLLMDQSIARSLLERSKTLTVSSGTSEYTMSIDVARIVSIKTGSNLEPLLQFAGRSDFDVWYFEHFGVASIDENYPPLAFYKSGVGNGNALKITFSPGVGAETSMILVYIKRPTEPISVSEFPPEVHGAISVSARMYAQGKFTSEEVDTFVSRMSHALQPIVGGIEKVQPDDRIRRIIRRANLNMSSSGLSFYSPKSAD